MISIEPTKPSSLPTTAKMKSVCCSGTKLPAIIWLWNSPVPCSPPEPIAILDCAAL